MIILKFDDWRTTGESRESKPTLAAPQQQGHGAALLIPLPPAFGVRSRSAVDGGAALALQVRMDANSHGDQCYSAALPAG